MAGGTAAIAMKEKCRKKIMRDDDADEEAQPVIDDAVALHRIADFELHHRRAGKLGAEAGAGEMADRGLLDLADGIVENAGFRRLRIERDDDQRRVARHPTGSCRR